MIEKTFAIIKPEAIEQKLIGKIITRIEESGLQITKMDMIIAPYETVAKHYEKDDLWAEKVGNGNLRDYAKIGKDPVQEEGTNDPVKLGRLVQKRTIEHLAGKKVVIMELSGEDAVNRFRALCGATEPASAAPESIRGTYSKDDYITSLIQKRPLLNLLHSSGNAEEAVIELNLWFS